MKNGRFKTLKEKARWIKLYSLLDYQNLRKTKGFGKSYFSIIGHLKKNLKIIQRNYPKINKQLTKVAELLQEFEQILPPEEVAIYLRAIESTKLLYKELSEVCQFIDENLNYGTAQNLINIDIYIVASGVIPELVRIEQVAPHLVKDILDSKEYENVVINSQRKISTAETSDVFTIENLKKLGEKNLKIIQKIIEIKNRLETWKKYHLDTQAVKQ